MDKGPTRIDRNEKERLIFVRRITTEGPDEFSTEDIA